jgi:glucosamine-phosphate N-acetyltransferase
MEFVNLYDYVVENFENITEIKNKYLFLLSYLTEVSGLSNKAFFQSLKRINSMGKIIVGIEDKTIVCSGTIIIESKLIHGAKPAAHIEDVVVLYDWRKKGIAQKLLENLQNIAIEEKCYKIILDCQEHLIPVYEKAEFHKHGIQMAKYMNF